jgi:ATP-binding cassette subfamily B protein
MSSTLPRTPLPFIWFFLKPYKVSFALFMLLQVATGFWAPLNSLFIKQLIDALNDPLIYQDYSVTLWPCVFLILNFVVFDNIVYRCADFFNYSYQALIKNTITDTMLHEILQKPHDFFQHQLSGALAKHVVTLTESIEIIAHKIGPQFVRGLSLLCLSLLAASTAGPIFCAIIAGWFCIFCAMSVLMARHLVLLANKVAARESDISGEIVDILSNQYNVRVFSQIGFERERLSCFLNKYLQAFQGRMSFVMILLSAQGACVTLFITAILVTLVSLYQEKLLSVGEFSMILGLSFNLSHTIWYIMWYYVYFNEAYGRAEQSLEALLQSQEKKSAEILSQSSSQIALPQGSIKIADLCFSYPNGQPIFNNLSLDIPAGQKVGLVGFSGSGKSTLINLILKIYQPSSGVIAIDGVDIATLTHEALHDIVSLNPQEPCLFNRSIEDNIAYGSNQASLESIVTAAHQAHAHDFIMSLDKGYKTFVGERGSRLSGGQRQRIALARSLLKKSAIIILDEATSQLDALTEHEVQKSLDTVLSNRTALIIAHRLSTLTTMDRILVFHKGQIIQDGTHKELVAQKGLYKMLWQEHTREEIPSEEESEQIIA